MLFADRDPEEIISLQQLASALPGRRPGKRLSYHAVLRWAIHGCQGRVLKSVKIGGLRRTTWRWASEFLSQGITPQRSVSKSHISKGRAKAFLDSVGI